ncbi:MAG: Gmad2 immunoglobulin-like domain-containing protein [Parcubacteria group bacterium]
MIKKIIVIAVVMLIGGGLIYYFLAQKSVNRKKELIIVENPQPNEIIQSPYAIKGQARGYWFFEGSFPIKLLDEKGNIIRETFTQAQDEWMTEDFIPFELILDFYIPKDQPGTLIFIKDNPSGLPENDAQIRVPVFLKASEI